VKLVSYSYTNNVLMGQIEIQNIAFSKLVSVFYANSSGWSADNVIAASYSRGLPQFTGYELWIFSANVTADAFYVEYQVSGQTFYDNNGGENYTLS
ncbi:hypothetical protein BC830DRAFT_1042718, partial [Chytriomyces sp. MP71]